MKRLIILVSFLLFVTISYAANKMSMVTYFPVPYVAYSQVSVDNQLDIGLTTSCAMNLGCSESDVNLKAQTVNLQKGKLELNNGLGIVGNTLTLGAGSGQAGQIKFNNVRIQSGSMQSVNAAGMNVKELQLFGNKFPSCKEKDASGEMKWQKLKLQGYGGTDTEGELYLTCGKLGESSGGCDIPDPIKEYKPCPNGIGQQTRFFNMIECEWTPWDTSACQADSDEVECCQIVKQKASFINGNGCVSDVKETDSTITFYGQRAHNEWLQAMKTSEYCPSGVQEGIFLAANKKGKSCYRGSEVRHTSASCPGGMLNVYLEGVSDRYVCKDLPMSAYGNKCNKSQISTISGF